MFVVGLKSLGPLLAVFSIVPRTNRTTLHFFAAVWKRVGL